jgi:hypothetical protein
MVKGTTTLGCLVMLVVFGIAVFYGVHVGEIYWRYYELVDGMRQQARLAGVYSDDSIRIHLTAQADSLLGTSPRFLIHRGPARATISTEYSEELDLPLLKRTLVLRPHVQEPF